jgi:hypothetical protein
MQTHLVDVDEVACNDWPHDEYEEQYKEHKVEDGVANDPTLP